MMKELQPVESGELTLRHLKNEGKLESRRSNAFAAAHNHVYDYATRMFEYLRMYFGWKQASTRISRYRGSHGRGLRNYV